jgi:uncharacterized protein
LAENKAYPENWKAPIPLVAPEAAGESFVADWSFSLPPGLDYSGLHYSLKGPLLVHAEKQGNGRTFFLEIRLSFRASAPCSRCLRETPLEITGSFRYFYTPSVAEEGQNVDEMTVTYPQDAVEIDLSEQIWESLVLSLPDQVLCRDDCAGLCPRCGADLNLGDCGCPPQGRDPRLQVLKDILPDVSEEE